jgi:hypothetical protein
MVDLLFDWFGISCMTTDKFCFYKQNRLVQTGQRGGQQYSDTSPFSIPWLRLKRTPAFGKVIEIRAITVFAYISMKQGPKMFSSLFIVSKVYLMSPQKDPQNSGKMQQQQKFCRQNFSSTC